MAQNHYKSVFELLSESTAIVRRNLRLFIILNILNILGLAWTIGTDLRNQVKGPLVGGPAGNYWDPYKSLGWGIVGIIIFILASVVLGLLATTLATRAASTKKVVTFADVLATFKKIWWRVIFTEVFLVILIVLGLVLLIIPGLYLVGRLGLAPYIAIDQKLGPIKSIKASWNMTRNRALPVFTAIFFGLALNLPSLVPVIGPIIGTVLLFAYSCGAPLRYFEYKKVKNAQA